MQSLWWNRTFFSKVMYQKPFTLIRVRVLAEDGPTVFKRPRWLIVMGERRQELSLVEAWEAYVRRYDVEHFFRFGKQRLLMAAYQTPEVDHTSLQHVAQSPRSLNLAKLEARSDSGKTAAVDSSGKGHIVDGPVGKRTHIVASRL